MYKVSELWVYPIKSLQGIRVNQLSLSRTGFALDRRWMLVDENNRFLTQRECRKLALFNVCMEKDSITVFHRQNSLNRISFHVQQYSGIEQKVVVWEDVCDALPVSEEVNTWFSGMLEQKVQLVYMPDSTHRKIDPSFSVTGNDSTSFSDGFPILMLGESSLQELNKRLDKSIGMERFRPNLVFSGGQPHDEDRMLRFTINNNVFFGVKPCARCVVTTLDPETGVGGREPLHTLSQYRKIENRIYFGQNVVGPSEGSIRTGDSLENISFSESDNFIFKSQ